MVSGRQRQQDRVPRLERSSVFNLAIVQSGACGPLLHLPGSCLEEIHARLNGLGALGNASNTRASRPVGQRHFGQNRADDGNREEVIAHKLATSAHMLPAAATVAVCVALLGIAMAISMILCWPSRQTRHSRRGGSW
jgi:hypothetical protein